MPRTMHHAAVSRSVSRTSGLTLRGIPLRAASTGKPLKYPWGADLPVVSGTGNLGGSEAFNLLGTALEGHHDEFPAEACASHILVKTEPEALAAKKRALKKMRKVDPNQSKRYRQRTGQ